MRIIFSCINPCFLHQKVLSCASVHNNTYNSPRQGPLGGITIENNVEIKNFKSIFIYNIYKCGSTEKSIFYMSQEFFLEKSDIDVNSSEI